MIPPDAQYGPVTKFSQMLHEVKYRGKGESFEESVNRVCSKLAPGDWYKVTREIMLTMRFMAAGRVQASVGSAKWVTALNCFVSGTIEDSMTDGQGSIMQRALDAAKTMRMGGGIGYDFSGIRPRGSRINKLDSVASGPVSFLHIFSAVCTTIFSAGLRRGAQMGTIRIDHPDIEEFIRVKQNITELTNFNLSIAVTDEFMSAVRLKKTFDLKFQNVVHKTVDACALWEMVMRSAWDWGEPGVLFIDTINRMNNLYYCENITTTNPCGEQPLGPFGSCLLGSFNLVKYIGDNGFNINSFVKDIPPVIRAMDNVIDNTIYPLFEQEGEAKTKRRMGIGVLGLASAGALLGLDYGSKEFLSFSDSVFATLRNGAYAASIILAAEKGSFPLLDKQKYLEGNYIKRLPDHLKEGIAEHGIRNSHLISFAPTGTIALCADNVSSGIEPIFEHSIQRIIQMENGPENHTIKEYAFGQKGVPGKLCEDVTLKEHIDVLALASQYTDSAVSKTINVGENVEWEEFKNIYTTAWARGCKGCTTFRANCKRMSLLKKAPDSVAQSCSFDKKGKKDCGE